MRICVIGAGIIGSSIAYELSKNTEIDVSVVDANYPGWGATAASFCWANANAKEPVPYFELNATGLSEYDRLAAELPRDTWLNRSGCLVTTPNDEEAELRVNRAASLGYAAELVSSDEVMSRIEPALRLRQGRKVAHFPTEVWIDAVEYLELLLGTANNRGTLCHFGRAVTGLVRQGDGSFVVELNDNTAIHADVVINAAGNGADKIAEMLGRRLVLAPTLGITMRVRSETFALQRIVRNLNVDARPDGPNLFRLHAATIDDRIARGGQDRNLIAAELMRRADELFHGFGDAIVVDTRIAPRPNVEDGLSWIGPVAGIDGYYEAVTHSGVSLAPLVSRLLAEEITAGRRSPLLAEFRPDRPSPVSA